MSDTKFCQWCLADGKTSIIRPVRCSAVRAIAYDDHEFWDATGVHHLHYARRIEQPQFQCSNGHWWQEFWGNRCPAPDCIFGEEPSVSLLQG